MIRFVFPALIVLGAATFIWAVYTTVPAHAATCGLASYYGSESGSTTANGEHFNPEGLTAASRGLPFNTRLRVTMLDPRPQMRRWYGKSVVVRTNDHGPYHRDRNGRYDRFLDLSKGAARVIGLTQSGVSKVCAERLTSN